MIELELGPLDEGALRVVLREQVSKRRAFLSGVCGVAPPAQCVLIVALPGAVLRLKGEVVYARDEEPGRGLGVQLSPIAQDDLAAIDRFLDGERAAHPALAGAEAASLAPDFLDLPMPPPPDEDAGAEAPSTDLSAQDAAMAALAALRSDESPESNAMHVRMRSLTGVEQRRIAATGNLAERVMLERLYGPNVWEPLLSSGRLSPPEVATIARKGTIPRPLLETIAANAGWLSSPEVQRALLANPRSSPAVWMKVLRLLPKHDLARVPMQTAYPAAVRQAAKELTKGGR
jgi:hypothetical protein